jgi:2-oxoisovalerate dehydrogenase E1 component alpha subunit
MELFAPIEPVEGPEHPQIGAGNHPGECSHRAISPLSGRETPYTLGTVEKELSVQQPDHWAGTEPARIIGPDGTQVGDADVGLGASELRELLRWMVKARRLDRECIALQRQGELTVYPGFEGQEAAQVGSATALRVDDFVFPTFRELAAAVVRGVDPVRYLWYHRGTWHGGPYDPRATRFGPICIPIATQIAHAAGYALGQKLDRSEACTLVYFGDGSTSEGDFHEAANLAGVMCLPVVFFCQNNGWAISVPTAQQTAGEIWRRAEGYGFPGVRVDGNDVLAVYRATRDAVTRARAGDGPTLIEALTYRIGSHSTADDARRYRDDAEVEAARTQDPISRYRTWLVAANHADDAFFTACEQEAEDFALDVRAGVIATEAPPVEWMFDWAYAAPSIAFERQRREALGG